MLVGDPKLLQGCDRVVRGGLAITRLISVAGTTANDGAKKHDVLSNFDRATIRSTRPSRSA